MRLDPETFLKIVELTPLVSIDLIIQNENGRILLGYRKNRPAKDFSGGQLTGNPESDFRKRFNQPFGIFLCGPDEDVHIKGCPGQSVGNRGPPAYHQKIHLMPAQMGA